MFWEKKHTKHKFKRLAMITVWECIPSWRRSGLLSALSMSNFFCNVEYVCHKLWVQPWSQGRLTDVQRGNVVFKMWRTSVNGGCLWDGTAGGLLAGQGGGKKPKRQKRCTPQRLVHMKVIRLMTVNNEPMECTAVLLPLSTSLSVWAKVKHWQVRDNDKHCHHKPIIKWSRKRLDRPTVLLQGLDNQAKHFHNQIKQMSHVEQLARKLSEVNARRQD